MRNAILYFAVILGVSSATPSQAQFVNDEFDVVNTLGPQWTVIDSNPAGSTVTLTGTHLRLQSMPLTDDWFHVNSGVSIQQNAPQGTNWEVVTKIDNYNPVETGYNRRFLKSGMQLWQDGDHWVNISLLNNAEGTSISVQAYWQSDSPAPGDAYTGFSVDSINFLQVTPGTTCYLKIVKSPKGYQTQFSANGTTWQTMLYPIRSLDTPDGYFTNEKIRLYQEGGPLDATNGLVKPTDFDYVRAAATTPPPSGYADDEFNGTILGPKWQFWEGFTPGTYTLEGGFLKFTSGSGQDVWADNDRGMRVYQDAPAGSKLTLTTKVAPADMIPFEQWNSYGMMLWQDQSNWVMITNHRSELTTNRVEVAFKRAGVFDGININTAPSLCPPYLRIDQTGNTYTTSFSQDNVTYTTPTGFSKIYPAVLRNAQVHLVNKRVFWPGDTLYSTAAQPQFDWLHATWTNAAEDWQLFE